MVEATQPPALPENPLAPPGFGPLVFEAFDGLNTQPSRPGIEDGQCYVCDGWMPIGKNNARVLPGVGPVLHTAPVAGEIVWYDFVNISTTPYCIVLYNDGSLQAVNTSTGMSSQIAPAGTIINPSVTNIGLSQWGSKYAIIVSPQTNGYFLWDGTTFYQAGGIGPTITITDGGSGYTTATVGFSGGSGSGATATATIVDGIITKITVTNPGTGYLASDTVTVGISGDGSGATATAGLMPFGVSGNTVETYTSRVWVGNAADGTFSAPGSVTDFSTSNGGGTFTSNDSFLRVGYTSFKQSNGFLYLIADSSINYISGVQTGGNPPTTTFTNQNADPEIGSPWSNTVDVFSRNIVFGNAFGAHVSYGGAVTKISDALDGIYNTVPNFGGFTPSGAKAIIFARRVWMMLLPVIDQITNQQINKLLMWDGKKWWTSQQDVPMIFIQHQEINSVITAYGTDGTSIYPLFQTPSIDFTKTMQSKLWSGPGGYEFTKASTRLWGLANIYSLDDPELFISIDNEKSSSLNSVLFGAFPVVIVNVFGNQVPVINSLGQTVVVLGAALGISVFDPTAVGQQGVLTGLTVSTRAADIALISVSLQNEVVQYRG